jgi:hypothetical protein
MRLIIPVAVLTVGIGCSSNWVVRGDPVPLRNCQPKLFYQDADQDGWGAGGDDGAWVVTCDADADSGFTASNGRDCDDEDSTNTGAVGSVCPQNLVLGDDDVFSVRTSGGSEFMAILGSESTTNYTAAATNCASWAGQVDVTPEAETATWEVNGYLATFSSEAEVVELHSLIEDSLTNGDSAAVYIGLSWSGTDPLVGEWIWVDGETDLPLNSVSVFDWCDDDDEQPTAGDFTPELNPNDEEGFDGGDPSSSPATAATLEMVHVRLAMIFDSEEWCLGVPEQPQTASYLCERTTPDPLDFVEIATEEEIEAGQSSAE